MVNGKFFDENVVNAAIPMGSEEVWVIQNPGGSWRHPVHIPFEEHRMLTRSGVPVKPATQLERRNRLLPSRRHQSADQRRNPSVHALP
jgi:FtsP/CotA-like multicopper oxidase with cupredoxin domain